MKRAKIKFLRSLFWALIFFCKPILAQQTDTLPTIRITDTKLINKFSGINTLDSLIFKKNVAQSITNILQQQNSFNIKLYGESGIATVSLRGASSTHTLFFWNGIPLNTSTAALTDVSIIPLAAANTIQIAKGSAAMLYGCGGIGGAVVLNNESNFNNRFSVINDLKISTLNSISNNVNINVGTNKWQWYSTLGWALAQNNYSYNYANGLSGNLPSQHASKYYVMQQGYYKLPKQQTISIKAWYNTAKQNLQPTILSANSDEYQQDKNIRTILDYQKINANFDILTQLAYTNNFLHYTNNVAHINDTIKTQLLLAKITSRYAFRNKILINNNIKIENNKAQGSNFTQNISETLITGNSTMLWQFYKNMGMTAIINIEKNNIKPIYIAPAMFIYYEKRWKQHLLRCEVNISKNHHNPSFNDKYWQPGGNNNLLPEKSQFIENIYTYSLKKSDYILSSKTSIYYGKITDLIIWKPKIGNAYWSADNIKKIKNAGIEIECAVAQQKMPINWNLQLFYRRQISTTLFDGIDNSAAIGKQLTYLPKNTAKINAMLAYKLYEINMQSLISDKSYTTTDNSLFLKPYAVVNIEISKKFFIKKQQIRATIGCQNLNNTLYETMPWRPMPPRTFNFNFQVAF